MRKTNWKTLARQAVKLALKRESITTEKQAYDIAAKFKPKEEEGYEITLVIHPLLPKTLKRTIDERQYKHPWFKGKVMSLVFEDTWGRVWNRTTGFVRKSTKLYHGSKNIWIDELGGMSWSSIDGKKFVCEFRTSEEEFSRGGPSPETFIG